MPFEKITKIQIYYEIYGDGTGKDTIVLLHHGFGCTKIWKEICPSLAAMGYRIITYDRRGYGRSEKGADFEEFYVSERLRPESVDELAELMKVLEINSFHIVGQCEGGVIGVDYVLKYPDQVQSLVISSTQCYSKINMIELNKMVFPKSFKDLEPELKEKLIDWHGEHAEPFYTQLRSYGGVYGKDFFDLRDLLPSVTCPTLVLYPDRSSIFEVEQGVAFYRHLPRGELAVLPSCGHNTYEYRPKEYVRMVSDFLGRHEDSAGVLSSQEQEINYSCLAARKK